MDLYTLTSTKFVHRCVRFNFIIFFSFFKFFSKWSNESKIIKVIIVIIVFKRIMLIKRDQADQRCLKCLKCSNCPKFPKSSGFICGVNKVEGLDELRLELRLDRLQVPYITTSFKRFGRKTEGEAEGWNRSRQCVAVTPKPKLWWWQSHDYSGISGWFSFQK